MADKVSRILLAAENRASREVERLSLQLQTFDKTVVPGLVKSGAAMAAGFLTVETALRAVGAGVKFMADSFKAAAEAERIQAGLARAVHNSGMEFDRSIAALRNHQRALQAVTTADDEAIAKAQDVLISLGKLSGPELKRATEATLDLAAGMGIDITQAATMLAKAAQGAVTQFTRMGLSFREGSTDAEKFGQVLDFVNKQYLGRAATEAQTTAGRMEQLAVAWENLKESFGSVAVGGGAVKVLDAIRDALDEVSRTLDQGKLSEKLLALNFLAQGPLGVWALNKRAANVATGTTTTPTINRGPAPVPPAWLAGFIEDGEVPGLDSVLSKLESDFKKMLATRHEAEQVEKQIADHLVRGAAAVRAQTTDELGRPIEKGGPQPKPTFMEIGGTPDFTEGLGQVDPGMLDQLLRANEIQETRLQIEHDIAEQQEITTKQMERTNAVALSVSEALGDWLIRGQDFGEMMANIARSLAQSLLDMAVKAIAQYIVNAATAAKLSAKQNTARIGELSAQTFAAAFASTAAIPIVGPALAPGVAAASTAAMLAGSSASFGVGLGIGAGMGAAGGGFAEGGLVQGPPGRDRVPIMATAGEGILTQGQTQAVLDGRAILVGAGARGGAGGDTYNVTINAVDARSFERLCEDNPRAIVAGMRRAQLRQI